MARRKLSQKEIARLAEHLSEVDSDSESDFSACSSDEYKLINSDVHDTSEDESTKERHESSEDESPEARKKATNLPNLSDDENQVTNTFILWADPDNSFEPLRRISHNRTCTIPPDIKADFSPLQFFMKLVPRSLFIHIAHYTNERMRIFTEAERKRTRIQETNLGEIQIVIGCTFIMSYNRVPCISDYWSESPSLKNESIQSAISRDRFKLITSKLYFAPPKKPENCEKIYYIQDVVECLKSTFQKYREDSSYQSIDESMTKFKGRSSLKQYMPMKPVKRGIKMWLRCDAQSGYTYDFNVYAGRETEQQMGTLGERVVKSLASTIQHDDVTLCFDRFFTTVNLLQTIKYPALGTCMSNRRNLPKIDTKLEKSQCVFKCTSDGLMYVKWRDTKDVCVLSNCHSNDLTTVKKTQKDGKKVVVQCPGMISFYREIMGGVDLADQMSGLYELDRKSTKWWKKVFYRLMMMAAVNSWIIYCQLKKKKIPFKNFLVDLAEELVSEGIKTTSVRRSSKKGRLSKKGQTMKNVSLHLPYEGGTRRRCKRCTDNKRQTRTRTMCQECDIPLCKNCFADYHK